MHLFARIICILHILGVCTATGADRSDLYDPPALYLTWQGDPAHTMTVCWQTVGDTPPAVYYRPLKSPGKWLQMEGVNKPFKCTRLTDHITELKGLSPSTDYEFCFRPGDRQFKFRTAPADLSEPVRFISGGDVYHERKWMDAMNAMAAKFDPLFVVIGGDLAYSGDKDKPEKIERWGDYFDSWKNKAVTPDGRLVPLLVSIGNHEVSGSWHQVPEKAPSFYTLFPMPGSQGYNSLDFGRYLTILLLDSSHTHPVEGAQTDWLRHTLASRRDVLNIFPVYHIPAYPSIRSDETGDNADITKSIRTNWCPLFDKYGVKIAFENHDHAYKRTHPIQGNKLNPDGVTYLGDGAWGVNLRTPDPKKPRWYVAQSSPTRHFYLVTLHPKMRHIVAINEDQQVFDEVYQSVAQDRH
ncbi:MAG: metallophosphoesterase family protein [Verrucomicrobiota bacterium]